MIVQKVAVTLIAAIGLFGGIASPLAQLEPQGHAYAQVRPLSDSSTLNCLSAGKYRASAEYSVSKNVGGKVNFYWHVQRADGSQYTITHGISIDSSGDANDTVNVPTGQNILDVFASYPNGYMFIAFCF